MVQVVYLGCDLRKQDQKHGESETGKESKLIEDGVDDVTVVALLPYTDAVCPNPSFCVVCSQWLIPAPFFIEVPLNC